jgi:hypothetical protein
MNKYLKRLLKPNKNFYINRCHELEKVIDIYIQVIKVLNKNYKSLKTENDLLKNKLKLLKENKVTRSNI